jgi:lipoprotein-anchoring transpeptidase ErfK/SrfK
MVLRGTRGVRGAAAVLVAGTLTFALVGCKSSSEAAGGTTPSGIASASTSPSASPSALVPVLSVAGGSKDPVSYLVPLKVAVADGTLVSVQVSTVDGDKPLEGDVAADGGSWLSAAPPKPGLSYAVVAQVKDGAGQSLTKTAQFSVSPVPKDQKLSFAVTPDNGETVGIGQPIDVTFLSEVTEKAAVEKAMTVDATTPTGAKVTGSWHWLNSQEVHWRPEKLWTPGTKVTLNLEIAGIKASKTRTGRKDYSETFTIGSSHISYFDAKTHRMTSYRDGKKVGTWLSGGGRPGLATYSGTYVVLNKSPVVQMDSCSARITCDKKDPDFYDEKEYWATRLTRSGTFVHAASWDGRLGQANVSHGCIHLSDKDAKTFYDHANVGDMVIVKNTGRGPQDRINTQDPGLYDWNLSWSAWTKGSALT